MGTQTVAMRRLLDSDLLRRFIVLAAIAYVVSFGMDRVVLAHGESIPYTVLWRSPSRVVAKGDYVMVEVTHPIIGAKPEKLTKQVACDEGDRLELRSDAFYCNGQRLGGFITRTWDDKPLVPFAYNGKIPEGSAFVMGTHPRSFDSRYFGLIEKTRMTHLVPIL